MEPEHGGGQGGARPEVERLVAGYLHRAILRADSVA